MTVYLVGAGPGSVDLLTLRAATLLRHADVVVTDRLVDESVLALVPNGIEVIDVGKRPGMSHSQELINDLLISLASSLQSVVRLKGGDPFVFGRGGEEALALREAGIDVEVVPGVTSAFAAPAAAGIPVTHRDISWGVTVVTGHTKDGLEIDFRSLANPSLTLVILMGITHRHSIAQQLMEGGLSPTTAVAVVASAWTQQQRIMRTNLVQLPAVTVPTPAVVVVGEVANLDVGSLSDLVLQVS